MSATSLDSNGHLASNHPVDVKDKSTPSAADHHPMAKRSASASAKKPLPNRALALAGIAHGWLDAKGRILEASDSLSQILGDPTKRLYGKSLVQYLQPDWQTTVNTRIAIGAADPTPTRYFCQLQRPDGGQPWAVLTLVPIARDEQTTAQPDDAQFQIVLQDMSWQRQASYEHESASTRYRDLFEATTDAIAVEHNNRILDVNPAFEQLFGYTHDEAVGKRQLEYIAPEAHFGVRQHLQSKHNKPIETVALDKSGERFPVEVQGKVIDYQGESVIYITIRDLREKKAAERAIRERDQLYRVLAGNLPSSAVCLFDHEMRVLLIEGQLIPPAEEQSAEELSNWKDAEGNSLTTVFPPNHGIIKQCLKTLAGEASQQEYTFVDRFIMVDTVPVLAEDGSVRLGMALARDVTESRKAAQQLASSERRGRALLDAIPDTLFVLSNQDIFTTYHTGDDPLVLLDDHVITEQTIQMVGMPDEIVNEILMYRDLALETRKTQAFECTMELGGEKQYLDARMVAISDGEVLTLFRNITHLKQIQQELAEHLEEMTLLRQVDEEFTQNLGLLYVMGMGLDTALRQSGGHAGFIVRFKDHDALEIDTDNLYIAGSYDIHSIQAQLSDKNSLVARSIREQKPLMRQYEADETGKLNNAEAALNTSQAQIVVPLYSMNEQKQLLGLVNLESNRTDRFTDERFAFVMLVGTRLASTLDNASLHKQTEEQLEELRVLYEKVTKLEQLKTDMIRIASHDLKNPLAGLTGHLEMLRWDLESSITDGMRVRLDKMRDAMRKMQDITTGILSLERIEQMAQNSTDKVFNLSELVRKTASEHEDDAIEKGQNFSQDVAATPLYINGDALQLHEAISNLMSNAIKYTPKGGDVSVYLEAEASQVVFRVVDTGFGVPQAQQKRLFEPFFRAKTDETANIEGTGLGLHLVKNIIERHGGEMVFESEYNTGSTFGFRLPLVPPPPNAGRDDLNAMRTMMVG